MKKKDPLEQRQQDERSENIRIPLRCAPRTCGNKSRWLIGSQRSLRTAARKRIRDCCSRRPVPDKETRQPCPSQAAAVAIETVSPLLWHPLSLRQRSRPLGAEFSIHSEERKTWGEGKDARDTLPHAKMQITGPWPGPGLGRKNTDDALCS